MSLTMFKPKHQVEKLDDGGAKITVNDPSQEGASNTVVLNKDQFARYENWMARHILIQHALYDLSSSDREILVSGVGPQNFDRMFASD